MGGMVPPKKKATVQKKKTKHTAAYPGWHDFVAGAVAGGGARMMTHPLDLVRIRRQLASFQHGEAKKKPAVSLWRDMVQVVQTEGGIRGLFRGNLAATSLWVSYTAVQFSSYNYTKAYFQTLFPENPSLVAFCAGASAGVAATLSSYPLDLCRTVFAARGTQIELESSIAAAGEQSATTQHNSAIHSNKQTIQPPVIQKQQHQFRPPKTTLEFATNLYQQRGWKGFFAGCSPTVLQIIPYMGCSFAIYDALTSGDRGVGLSAYAGSLAGAVSKTLVYPMDTVKKRLRKLAGC